MNSRKHSPPFTILHLYPLPNFPSPLTYQSYQIISVSGIHPLSWHSRRPCHFILQWRDTNCHFPCNKARGQCCSFASTTAAPAFRTWQNGTCSFSYTWFVGKKTCITSETLKMHALSENYCLRLHKFISIQNHLKQPAGHTIIAELHCLSIEPVLSSQNFITYDCKLSNESSTGHQRCFVVWLGVLFFCTVVISSSLFPINSLSASRPFEWWNKRHDLICVPTFWHNCECTSMMYYVHLILSETMFASQIAFSLWFFVTQLAAQVSHLQALISGQLSAVSKFLGHKPWYLDLSHPFIFPCCGDTIWQLQASIWKVLESAIVMMQHRSVWSHLKLLFFSENHKGNPCGDVCMNWTIQQKFWTNLQFNTRPSKFW